MSKPVMIQPDKTLRRRVAWVMVIAALVAGWAVIVVDDHLKTLTVASDDPKVIYDQLRILVNGFLLGTSAVTLVLVAWLGWSARRIFKADQFPLPGQRVLRPTPLRTGAAARRLAWILLLTGTGLVILHSLTIYYFLHLLGSVRPL
jgi:hypothetical protein